MHGEHGCMESWGGYHAMGLQPCMEGMAHELGGMSRRQTPDGARMDT